MAPPIPPPVGAAGGAGNNLLFQSGTAVAIAGTNTLTITNAGSTTFADVLSGSGGLIKQGTSTLTLTGANTYTGPTSVQQGFLFVNGSLTSNVPSSRMTMKPAI